jgi:hypothetical protein
MSNFAFRIPRLPGSGVAQRQIVVGGAAPFIEHDGCSG